MKRATFSMNVESYLVESTLLTALKDMGVSPANVVRRAKLAADLLQQPSTRLSPSDYHNLWECIEDEAGDPLFAIHYAQALRAESFSLPLFAALCSPNFAVAVERLARYKALVAPIKFIVSIDIGTMTVEARWQECASKPPFSLVMAEMLSLVALARIGTREQVCPQNVVTIDLPKARAAYEAFLGGPFRSGTSHRMTFSLKDAVRPFLTSCDTLWTAFEPELRQRLADLDGTVTMTQRVHAVLLETLPVGLVTMDAVARKLAMGKRTLQRRILAEGSTFQAILNQTREALALHYLGKTSLSTSKISFLLGFEEPNSFNRAFKEWTGNTPESVRHPKSMRH